MRRTGSVAMAALLILCPVIAAAQLPPTDALPPPPDVQRMIGSQPSRPGPVCTKLCAADTSPCDPIYMKEADGRCDGLTSDMEF